MQEEKMVSFRLSSDQYEELARLALINNCSVEQLLVKCALGKTRDMPDARRQLFSELAAFGSGLRALYSQLKKGGHDAEKLDNLLWNACELLDAAWLELGLHKELS